MDVEVVRVTPGGRPDRVRAQMRVTTRGAAPEQVSIEIDNPIRYVVGMSGLIQAADGTWHSPYQVVGDRWQWFPDPAVEWMHPPLTSEEIQALVRPQLRRFHHRHVIADCRAKGFGEYVDGGIRVVPYSDVHLGRGGVVEVKAKAYDVGTGEQLDTHDDIYQFELPPMFEGSTKNPCERLKQELARIIRERNGR